MANSKSNMRQRIADHWTSAAEAEGRQLLIDHAGICQEIVLYPKAGLNKVLSLPSSTEYPEDLVSAIGHYAKLLKEDFLIEDALLSKNPMKLSPDDELEWDKLVALVPEQFQSDEKYVAKTRFGKTLITDNLVRTLNYLESLASSDFNRNSLKSIQYIWRLVIGRSNSHSREDQIRLLANIWERLASESQTKMGERTQELLKEHSEIEMFDHLSSSELKLRNAFKICHFLMDHETRSFATFAVKTESDKLDSEIRQEIKRIQSQDEPENWPELISVVVSNTKIDTDAEESLKNSIAGWIDGELAR